MKKFAVSVVICFFLVLPTISFGASGMYGSFNGGIAQPADGNMTISGVGSTEQEFDTSFTAAGAIGYRFGDFGDFRVEGEAAYQKSEVDRVNKNSLPVDLSGGVTLSSMEASVLTFLLNGYIDFYYGSAFSWFITAGFGVAGIDGEMTVNGVTSDDDDTGFAYQLGAGAGYALTETVTLDCKYRYLHTEEINIEGGDIEVASPSHNITLGIRVAF